MEKNCLVYTELTFGMREENRTILTTFFKPFKELMLEPAELTVHFLYGTDEIIFSSNYVIKNLYISHKNYFLKYSDNYFDVIPNHKVKVLLKNPEKSLQELKSGFVFKSFREIFDPSPLKIVF